MFLAYFSYRKCNMVRFRIHFQTYIEIKDALNQLIEQFPIIIVSLFCKFSIRRLFCRMENLIFGIKFHFFYKISASRTHVNIQHTVDILEFFKERKPPA